ncbi:AsnC family transcriptional regulator [Actinocorallia libanotica]|uniref:HTH asnC-type domain-containing protein n=1 Tax=Actinocorallia libanotica TaxID=46162 RepID=A0ABN1REQ0_9ACTN
MNEVLTRRLAAVLAADPRCSYQELAEQVGLSRITVKDRLQRLLESGSVRLTGCLHPVALGLPVAAELVTDAAAARVADALAGHPAVRISTVGDGFTEAALHARDDEQLAELAARVRAAGASVRLFRVLRTLRGGLPACPRPARMDELDHRLAQLVIADPRARLTRLAPELGLSDRAVGTRLKRLLDTRTLVLQVLVRPEPPVTAFRVEICSRAGSAHIAHQLKDVEGITYLATGRGSCEVLVRLRAHTSFQQRHQLRTLKRLLGIGQMTIRQYPTAGSAR